MPQADFIYDTPSDGAGLQATISLFADRENIRGELSRDLQEAGFKISRIGGLADLIDGDEVVLGDAVVLDCPVVDAAALAALSRLDVRIARSGTPLIVMTTIEALDVVFGCFEQTSPQILVDSGPAERMVAIGRILGKISGLRLRELSDAEQLTLLRLTQQVEAIARKIDAFSKGSASEVPKRLSDKKWDFRAAQSIDISAEPRFPKPSFVRHVIRQRQARYQFFDGELFADPAWDMLLDLTAAHGEGQQVCVSSLCIAANVPATTALRWIRQMVESGIFTRVEDSDDKRRAFIELSEASRDAMARYFAAVEEPLAMAA